MLRFERRIFAQQYSHHNETSGYVCAPPEDVGVHGRAETQIRIAWPVYVLKTLQSGSRLPSPFNAKSALVARPWRASWAPCGVMMNLYGAESSRSCSQGSRGIATSLACMKREGEQTRTSQKFSGKQSTHLIRSEASADRAVPSAPSAQAFQKGDRVLPVRKAPLRRSGPDCRSNGGGVSGFEPAAKDKAEGRCRGREEKRTRRRRTRTSASACAVLVMLQTSIAASINA